MNLSESREGNVEEFEGREGKNVKLNYNFKNNREKVLTLVNMAVQVCGQTGRQNLRVTFLLNLWS